MGDGRIVLCDGNTVSCWPTKTAMSRPTRAPGGSPWGTVCWARIGAIYVTQGGSPGSGDTSVISGIQRVSPDGTVELLFSEVAGYKLYEPTISRLPRPETAGCISPNPGPGGFRFDVRARRAGCSPWFPGRRSMLMELPGVYRTGWPRCAAAALLDRIDGAPRRRMENGEPVTFLPALRWASSPMAWRSPPTGGCSLWPPPSPRVSPSSRRRGMCWRRSVSASTTNCIFDGPALYVTAEADIEASARRHVLAGGHGRTGRPGPHSRWARGHGNPGRPGPDLRRPVGFSAAASAGGSAGRRGTRSVRRHWRARRGAERRPDAGQRAKPGVLADQNESVAVPGELLPPVQRLREQQPCHLGRVGIVGEYITSPPRSKHGQPIQPARRRVHVAVRDSHPEGPLVTHSHHRQEAAQGSHSGGHIVRGAGRARWSGRPDPEGEATPLKFGVQFLDEDAFPAGVLGCPAAGPAATVRIGAGDGHAHRGVSLGADRGLCLLPAPRGQRSRSPRRRAGHAAGTPRCRTARVPAQNRSARRRQARGRASARRASPSRAARQRTGGVHARTVRAVARLDHSAGKRAMCHEPHAHNKTYGATAGRIVPRALSPGMGRNAGLGRAIALRLSAESLLICTPTFAGTRSPAASPPIIRGGGAAEFARADVFLPARVRTKLAARAVASTGQLDVVVDDAAFGRHSKPMLDTEDQDFDAIMAVNVRDLMLCRAAVRQMLTQPAPGRRPRPDREHHLAARDGRRARARGLRHQQGSAGAADPPDRGRDWARWHHLQQRRPGEDRHRHAG